MTPLTKIIGDAKRRANLEKRFWPKVQKGADNECWPWIAEAKHPFGYGRMTAGRGVNLKAHQIAWALENGPIPDGARVLHSCDNPPCCNSAHLFCGTMRDNTLDMIEKGRGGVPPLKYGEQHGMSKLTEADVMAIRSDESPAADVATRFGVSAKTVYRIRKRLAWAHI